MLLGDRWILDLQLGEINDTIMLQRIHLARAIREAEITLQPDITDEIAWTGGGGSSEYSASSAYAIQFSDRPTTSFKPLIWKTWASGHVKMFCWLLHQDKLWCNDRLQRRGWENGYFCALCSRSLESSVHLFWECPFARRVWTQAASWRSCEALRPDVETNERSPTEIVTSLVLRSPPAARRGVQSLME